MLDEAGTLSLAHTDCDIYESVRHSYEICKLRMVTKGYVVFDDSTVSSCIGDRSRRKFVIARDGLLSEQIYPHHVQSARSTTGPSGIKRVEAIDPKSASPAALRLSAGMRESP